MAFIGSAKSKNISIENCPTHVILWIGQSRIRREFAATSRKLSRVMRGLTSAHKSLQRLTRWHMHCIVGCEELDALDPARFDGEALREMNMGNILIADDDKTCRDSIQKLLEKEGHTVQTARDVDSALKTLATRHFDLVVCDYRMPGITGIELLIELKARQSRVPVLMISAYADVNIEKAVLELGALDLLKKPSEDGK